MQIPGPHFRSALGDKECVRVCVCVYVFYNTCVLYIYFIYLQVIFMHTIL